MEKYRELMERIHVPLGLNERVLEAASERRRNSSPTEHRLLRGAVCAVCALAMVLGTVSLHPTKTPVPDAPGVSTPLTPMLSYSFGITAGAVENTVNGGLVFRWENGCGSFRICGEESRLMQMRFMAFPRQMVKIWNLWISWSCF